MCIIVQWYAMYVYFVYTGWSMKSSNNWQSKICCPDLCGTWRPTNLDTEGTLAAGTHAKESKEKQAGRKVWQDVVQSLSLEYSHVLMLPGSQPTALTTTSCALWPMSLSTRVPLRGRIQKVRKNYLTRFNCLSLNGRCLLLRLALLHPWCSWCVTMRGEVVVHVVQPENQPLAKTCHWAEPPQSIWSQVPRWTLASWRVWWDVCSPWKLLKIRL